jgi:hypothetical protein
MKYLREIFSLAGIGLFGGLAIGMVAGLTLYEVIDSSVCSSLKERAELEQLCIDGNDRACRVLELRGGR